MLRCVSLEPLLNLPHLSTIALQPWPKTSTMEKPRGCLLLLSRKFLYFIHLFILIKRLFCYRLILLGFVGATCYISFNSVRKKRAEKKMGFSGPKSLGNFGKKGGKSGGSGFGPSKGSLGGSKKRRWSRLIRISNLENSSLYFHLWGFGVLG